MNERLKKTIVQKSVRDYCAWFDALAQEILNAHTFRIRHSFYEITEIEFYVYDDIHTDANSHATPMQKTSLKMVFHTHGPSFKEGSYKGVDISMGNKNRYGGILIRGLKALKDNRLIDGPSKVVDEILLQYKESKVRDLLEHIDVDIDGNDFELVSKVNDKIELFKCPRVGLSLKKNSEKKISYLLRDYRYLKYPELSKKGRPFIIASAVVHQKQIALSSKVKSTYETLIKRGKKRKAFQLSSTTTISELIEYYGHLSCNKINDNP